MNSGTSRSLHAALLIAVLTLFSVPASGQPSSSSVAGGARGLLPRNFIVSLVVVSQFFPDITQEVGTGEDLTAVGKPKATRAVFFTNGDGSKKVTITVGTYRNSKAAAAAYQQAVDASEAVPGFQPIVIPAVGEKAFAGSVTMGAETHVGLGALDGRLLIGATLAGFDATTDNVTNLVGLARAEDAAANAAARCDCGH